MKSIAILKECVLKVIVTACRAAAEPIIYLVLFLILVLIWQVLKLPTGEILITKIREIFMTHGFPIVFVCAFLEGLLLINLIFPGSIVIALAVAASAGFPLKAATAVALTGAAFLIANTINYYIGLAGLRTTLGWLQGERQLQKTETWLNKYGGRLIFISYANPNLASFVATAAGRSIYPFKRFLCVSILGTLFWGILLGAIVYWNSSIVSGSVTSPALVFGVLLSWAVLRVIASIVNQLLQRWTIFSSNES